MMKKKILLIIGAVICIGIVAGFLFFMKSRFISQKQAQKVADVNATPTPYEELVVWDDPAGFTFQYPKGLQINKHDEDTENYAHVEITNPDHKGSVIIWVKDTTATTIAQWLKNEKSLQNAASVDTTLGGNVAKKILMKVPKVKQITAALDEDVLVMVETDLEDQEFWQRVNDVIVGNLSFSTSKKDDTASGDSSGIGEPAVAADEEESVE